MARFLVKFSVLSFIWHLFVFTVCVCGSCYNSSDMLWSDVISSCIYLVSFFFLIWVNSFRELIPQWGQWDLNFGSYSICIRPHESLLQKGGQNTTPTNNITFLYLFFLWDCLAIGVNILWIEWKDKRHAAIFITRLFCLISTFCIGLDCLCRIIWQLIH